MESSLHRIPWLGRRLVFPDPEGASPEGVVAAGGDLSTERLLLAYSQGIFPWPSEGLPLLWFCPDPRSVLPIGSLRVPRSVRKALLRTSLRVTFDAAFDAVIDACATVPRGKQRGTWIDEEMSEAYRRLHALGVAHSVEVWAGEQLVGGLYGVSLGRVFFGESMFSRVPEGSRAALVVLVARLRAWGFAWIDCQVSSPHLTRLGAVDMSRRAFLQGLREHLAPATRVGSWDGGTWSLHTSLSLVLGAGHAEPGVDDPYRPHGC